MEHLFEVVLIDDKPDDTTPLMGSVKLKLEKKYGYRINYTIISSKKQLDRINETIADIVMFDYNLSASDFSPTGSSHYGFELIKEYRKNNNQTKVMFYSSRFSLKDPDMGLTATQLVNLINDLNVFKIIERRAESFIEGIVSAIENIDTVLISFDELINRYGDDGPFIVGGSKFTGRELLRELKLGTQTGNLFLQQINSTILTYFMKFGGDNE